MDAHDSSMTPILWFACLAAGASVTVLTLTLMRAWQREKQQPHDEWRFDVNRMAELRRRSLFYRLFFPLVRLLARFNRGLFADRLPEIDRQIQAAGLLRYWAAEEYLAKLQLQAAFSYPLIVYGLLPLAGSWAWGLGLLGALAVGLLLRRRLTLQARHRLFRIKKGLPFLLDLLTLLMEAGATFLQALEQAVDEFRDHPAGVEFGRVLSEIRMGQSRASALEALRARLNDDEIGSIVGAIIQGEQLGTPLAQIFRSQADVLRIKRSQRAETIAGEAGVQMLAPSVLVMAATVIIILGPFILGIVYSEFM